MSATIISNSSHVSSERILTVINQGLTRPRTLLKLSPVLSMIRESFLDAGECSVKSVRSFGSQSLLQFLAEQAVFKPIENYDLALFLAELPGFLD